MIFLTDANVLSEATKNSPSARVVAWLRKNEVFLAVNPVILGELEYGILQLPSGRRRKQLEDWFSGGIGRLRVFDIDSATATTWAHLLAKLKRKGLAMPVKDSLIAASALQHDLTIATRNVRDFRHCGARVVNPFD